MPLFLKKVSTTQCKDAGLALVLVSLILAITVKPNYFLPAGLFLLIVAMTCPNLFQPFAKFWFGFSHALGGVVSRILLTLLFYTMVMPVGLVRRALGKDTMQLKNGNRIERLYLVIETICLKRKTSTILINR